MKDKIKKIFAIFVLPIIFSSHFPFLTTQTKQKEEILLKRRPDLKQENPEIPHTEYPVERNRNWFISSISTTVLVVSNFIDDIFHREK